MAPTTAAERQRKRREKLKQEGKYDAYKQQHCRNMKKYRSMKADKMKKLPKAVQEQIKSEERRKNRGWVKKCREQKNKKASSSVTPTLYKSASAFGKAVARAKRSLPGSPRHRQAVVRKLFSSECNVGLASSFDLPKTDKKSSALCPDIVNKICMFYERDDISRIAPGRKDVVTLWKDGVKMRMQARHLICTLKEVFQLFKLDNPTIVVGKSKFFQLRPKHVLLSSQLPHNVCMCVYHENFIIAVNTLHTHEKNFPIYSHSFPEGIICNPSSESCWLNECQQCKNAKGFHQAYPLPEFDEINVKWHCWKKSSHNDPLQKVEEVGSFSKLYKYIADMVPQFLEHCYVKRHQANSYKITHELVISKDFPRDLCMIQVDFSENYTCVFQDEIQSAHWSQNQVSLFTCAMYHTGVIHPLIIVSDVLDHSKETVLAYISYVLDDMPNEIQKVEIWSDGPSSQFKNRFVAASLPPLEESYGVQITWNFFATSHGKGPVDGIGGSSKRMIFDQVKKRKCIVNNAADYVKAAKIAGSNIKIFELDEEGIKKRNSLLNLKKVWDNAQAIQGIKKIHNIKVINKESKGFLLSNDQPPDSPEKVSVGDWYEVQYDDKLYPGEITNISNGEFEVKTMERSGKHWKWPVVEDKIFYPQSKLIRKLNPPIVVN